MWAGDHVDEQRWGSSCGVWRDESQRDQRIGYQSQPDSYMPPNQDLVSKSMQEILGYMGLSSRGDKLQDIHESKSLF